VFALNAGFAPELRRNALLASLPADELVRLRTILRVVPLTPGQQIIGVNQPLPHLYFVLSGSVARLAQIQSGETVEVGFIGSEGAVGLSIALGGSAPIGLGRVQAGGSAAAISVSDFNEHVRAQRSALFDALLAYANVQMHVIAQLAACHCLHRIEQRLSRCILSLEDHSNGAGSVQTTHDSLAEFLGVHRPSVTYALQALAAEGAIGVERRRLIVRNRALLESHACECYAAIRNLIANHRDRAGQENA
jgi:CRP-like cAMP-binding protein